MQTLKLEVEDSKLDVILTILNNLKENVVKKYEIIQEDREKKILFKFPWHL